MTNFRSKGLMVTLRPKKVSLLDGLPITEDSEMDVFDHEELQCAGASCKATNKILACEVTNDDDSNCKTTNDPDGITCKRTNDDDADTCKRTNDDDADTCKRTNDDDADTCKRTNDDDADTCKRTNDDDSTCKVTNKENYDKKAQTAYNERLIRLKQGVAQLRETVYAR